jgi:biopolymer transport protein ExbD
MAKTSGVRSERLNEELPFCFTSMIDVVFLLLIFFLVATSFKQPENRLDTNLPKDEGLLAKKIEIKKPEELCIYVMDDRKTRSESRDFNRLGKRKATYYLGRRESTPTTDPYSFFTALKQRASNPEQAVLISLYSESDAHQDQKVPFQNIISLIDVCKKAGIVNIKFQGPATQ